MNQATNTTNLPTALNVADYLLLKGKTEGVQISNKKLQKLLYYTQAWSAALNDEKVFQDRIEAWIHGPAIKEVYLAFQQYGAQPITKEINEDMIKNVSSDARKLIDKVWEVYSTFDANYLEHLTHSETPWQDARKDLEPHTSSANEITFESMRTYYKTLLPQ
jgi:uncharacterized phage-associated protein